MSRSTPLVPISPFAPSELILLNGDQYATPARLSNNVELLHVEAKVSAEQLGQAMLAAAFLASERMGGIRLEVRQKKAMMGLRKVMALFVEPGDDAVAWPAHSLESQLHSLAVKLQADKGQNEVSNILYVWLRDDSAAPWNVVTDLVKQGMADRGLLEQVETKKLKVFTSRSFVLPENTAALAAQQTVQPIQRLLEAAERERAEMWKLLTKQIKDAIKKRTESSDMDY